MTIEELKVFEDRTVVLRLTDGEVLTANVAFVDREYEDIIVDVLETTQPHHYKVPNAAYAIPVAEIVSVEPVAR